MRKWVEDARKRASIRHDGLICYDAPEDSGLEDECRELGKALAEA